MVTLANATGVAALGPVRFPAVLLQANAIMRPAMHAHRLPIMRPPGTHTVGRASEEQAAHRAARGVAGGTRLDALPPGKASGGRISLTTAHRLVAYRRSGK